MNDVGDREGSVPDGVWWTTASRAALDGSSEAVAGRQPRSSRHRSSGDSRRALPLALLRGLARLLVDRMRRSERLHRLGMRGALAGGVALAVAAAVGVIMLNNLVISRSAELGRLEDERRQLRTDNAKVAAENAMLSAPPRITQIAEKRLQMQRASVLPRYVYLEPPVRPIERARAAVRRTPPTRRPGAAL